MGGFYYDLHDGELFKYNLKYIYIFMNINIPIFSIMDVVTITAISKIDHIINIFTKISNK